MFKKNADLVEDVSPNWVPISQKVGSLIGTPYLKAWGSLLVLESVEDPSFIKQSFAQRRTQLSLQSSSVRRRLQQGSGSIPVLRKLVGA